MWLLQGAFSHSQALAYGTQFKALGVVRKSNADGILRFGLRFRGVDQRQAAVAGGREYDPEAAGGVDVSSSEDDLAVVTPLPAT